jgi:DNA-binding NtrC family response regulator
VHGEMGAGKELAVCALHRLSDRARGPLNCTTRYAGPLASRELFGDAKDYPSVGIPERTGKVDAAEHGFLFLDAVREVSKEIDEQLLRLVERGEFRRAGESGVRRADVRVVVTSPLAPTLLRGELFQRLTRVRVPPLREHREDIPLFVRHFLREYVDENRPDVAGECADGTEDLKVHRRLIDYLLHSPLQGNVRELRHIVRDAARSTPRGVSVRLPSNFESATPGVYNVPQQPN